MGGEGVEGGGKEKVDDESGEGGEMDASVRRGEVTGLDEEGEDWMRCGGRSRWANGSDARIDAVDEVGSDEGLLEEA